MTSSNPIPTAGSTPDSPPPRRVRQITWSRRALVAGVAAVACALPATAAMASVHADRAPNQKVHKPPRRPARPPKVTITKTVITKPRPTKTVPVPRVVVVWPWGQALHGSLTVPGANGGTTGQDLVLQRGTITDVQPTTITVRSVDGFTATWTITAATKVGGRPFPGIPGIPGGHRVTLPTSASVSIVESSSTTSSTSSSTTSSTTSSSTTSSSTTTTTTPATTTGGLVVGQQVGLWGTGAAATPTALALSPLAPPRATPTATSTSSSSSTSSSTTSSTTSTPSAS